MQREIKMQLNVEQKRIIESKANGHTLIKGVAGSGKTTVAVNKIPLLLRHYCAKEEVEKELDPLINR